MASVLTMPEVATGTTEAVLSSWIVDVGAPFSSGQAIVSVETDKAIVDVEAESDGVLLHLLAAAGARVEVGAPIAIQGGPGEQVDDLEALLKELGVADQPAASVVGADEPEADGSIAAAEAAEADDTLAASEAAEADMPPVEPPAAAPVDEELAASPPVAPPSEPPTAAGRRLFSSPLARKLAREAGLDIAEIRGSGPNGRVRRLDVETALQERTASSPKDPAGEAAPVPGSASASYTDVPLTGARRAIARRLTESKQSAPHFYLRGSARVDRLMEIRAELTHGGEMKVSVNDLVVKAVAKAHQLVPGLNVQWTEDAIRQFTGVDVAIAVATEHALLTPVLRNVEALTVSEVAKATQDLVARARNRRLQQSELEGGTISVTNLGMYGTEEFAAIINPPHASILAVGAARQEPVSEDGQLAVGTVMRVTLAVDHRPVDGATAAQWMRAFIDLLERPLQILV